MKNTKRLALSEPLVIIGIIGILAAIALPQFAAYRAAGFDARARLELSRAVRTQNNLLAGTGHFVKLSLGTANIDGETIVVPYNGAEDARWLGVVRHRNGVHESCYDSLANQIATEGDRDGNYERCRTAFDTLKAERDGIAFH